MRLVSLALVSALARCSGGPEPAGPLPKAPSAPAPAASASAPIVVATAEPSVAPAALPAVDVSAIHRIWQALFLARENVGSFTLIDDVDPHDPSGKRIKTKLDLTCAVLTPYMMDGSAHGALECSGPGGELSLHYRSDERGLFLQGDGSLPTFTADQAGPKSVKFDAGDNTEQIPCTRKRSSRGSVFCVETKCKVKVGYGDTSETLCLDAGVVEYESVNIGGPRTRKLRRISRPE